MTGLGGTFRKIISEFAILGGGDFVIFGLLGVVGGLTGQEP